MFSHSNKLNTENLNTISNIRYDDQESKKKKRPNKNDYISLSEIVKDYYSKNRSQIHKIEDLGLEDLTHDQLQQAYYNMDDGDDTSIDLDLKNYIIDKIRHLSKDK